MQEVVYLFSVITLGVSLVVLYVAARIAWLMRTSVTETPPSAPYLPKAAVILSIRGGDPYLLQLLESLAHLDYPDYQVHVIVDNAEDPEWELVKKIAERSPHIFIPMILESPAPTCGLKNSALIQGVERSATDREVFAFVDADAHIYPGWLRELVQPLQDSGVGASTGNRWYMPSDGRFGSLVRYFWNAAGVGYMWLFDIAWGGSMAIKRSAIDRADLLNIWRNSLTDDTPVAPALQSQGLTQAFAPLVIVVNRESMNVRQFLRWGARQTLMSRLYTPQWPLIVLQILLQCAWRLFAPLFALALALNNSDLWLPVIVTESFYWASIAVAAIVMETAVRNVLRNRDDQVAWISPSHARQIPLALVATHFIVLCLLITAMRLRRVHWRGIEYTISPDLRIRMQQYRPFYRAQKGDNESIL